MAAQGLTVTQVAGRLGVASITVRKWCARGLFPRAYMYETPLGALWMIPEVDLKNFEPPKMGRPPKVALCSSISGKRVAGQASAKNGTSGRSVGTTRKLNKAFRKATEAEGKKGGGR